MHKTFCKLPETLPPMSQEEERSVAESIPFVRWEAMHAFFKDPEKRAALLKHILSMKMHPGTFKQEVAEALMSSWVRCMLYMQPQR